MAIAVICPKLTCRSILRVPDEVRGQRVRCSSCGLAFYVPQVQKPSAAPVAPRKIEPPAAKP